MAAEEAAKKPCGYFTPFRSPKLFFLTPELFIEVA
jgi:hypothetical protein